MTKGPAHDPEAEGALILFEPTRQTQIEILESMKSTALGTFSTQPKQHVHVVVDPLLSRVLRPHQVEGVKFLYDCVTGAIVPNAFGCIMADEMGLGKTLQCITLLWTLLKQSPEPGKPTVEKVNIPGFFKKGWNRYLKDYFLKGIIACPSSLVRNWANELQKWLGPDRIRPLACDNKSTKAETIKSLNQFVCSKGRSVVQQGFHNLMPSLYLVNTNFVMIVLIISYESLRSYIAIITKTEIGLLLCDEGKEILHKFRNPLL
jgi:DNA repair and recombination protein RAD54 and RAD54-like protein